MSETDSTRWTVIRDAAAGDRSARRAFAKHYLPAVRAYLAARWQGHALIPELEDAVQEVFVECFKDGGVLEKAEPERGGFRALLYGVTRNVALRLERRRGRKTAREIDADGVISALPDDDQGPSGAFDRAWAAAIMRQAGERMLARARAADAAALRRVELLRVRTVEGRPIRDIARDWDADPTQLHRAYARARREFKAALLDVLRDLQPGPRKALEAEALRLVGLFG